jgi:hypothetical protein
MAKELAKLFVTLGIDDSEFGKKLNSIQKNLTQAGKIMTGLGVSITAALGLSVKAAEEERVNIARLDSMLQNVGVSYDQVSESLERNIKSTQDKTGVADNEQRDMLSNLVFAVGDYQKALDLLPLSLDLMAAKQMDAKTAAELLGKVSQGEFGTLSRYGIILEKNATAAEALAAIQEKVAGSAEKMASPIDILKASFGDLVEKIGTNLLPLLKSIVEKIMPIIDGIGAWMDKNPKLANTLIIVAAAVGGLMTVVGPLLMMLPMIAAGFTMMLGPAGLIVLAIAAVAAGAALLIMNWDKVVAFFQSLPEKIGVAFAAVKDFILAPFRAAWAAIGAGINWVINQINKIHFTIPDWIPGLGGKSFGISIPNIELPQFGTGAIITRPTLGLIGEAGPEAVVPLGRGIGGLGSTAPVINITVQGSVITERDLWDSMRKQAYRTQSSNYSLGFT